MAKDSRGFLWLGTAAGLSMFDGYNFQNHPYSKDKELIGYVNVIKPGPGNRLWIGSGAGLFCLENNEIIKISAATLLPQGVNDILPGENDNTWLATENGPVKFNLKEVDFTGKNKILLSRYLLKQWYLEKENIDKRRTVLISKAPDGAIFIAQYNSLFRFWDNRLGLLHSITDPHNKINAFFL